MSFLGENATVLPESSGKRPHRHAVVLTSRRCVEDAPGKFDSCTDLRQLGLLLLLEDGHLALGPLRFGSDCFLR
jgi:hypothetical protein